MIYRIVAILSIIAITIIYSIQKKQNLNQSLSENTGIESVLKKLPASGFLTIEGHELNFESLYNDKKPSLVMVHFWGTWCAPCEAELPELLSLIKKYKGQSQVLFLLVAVNDEVVKIRKHLKDANFETPENVFWLMDNNNTYRDVFGTTRVPETYVFSSDKTLLRKFIGPQQWSNSQYLQTFEDLLQSSSRKL